MFTILLNATLNLSIHDQFELENHTEILKTNGINISLLTVKDIRLGPEKDFFTTITLPTDYSLTDSILEKLNKDTISPRIISYALSHDVDIIVTDNKKLLKVKYDKIGRAHV